MTVFLERSKTAILEIPKTATRWVRKALECAGVPIGTGGDRTHDIHVPRESEYVVTFVRHPVAYLKSRYYYDSPHLPGIDFSALNDPQSPSFSEFVELFLSLPGGVLGRYFNLYTTHCDFVGTTENIARDLVGVLRERGESFDEQAILNCPPTNTTKSKMGLFRETKGEAVYTSDQIARLCKNEEGVIHDYFRSEPSCPEAVGVSGD